MCVCNLLVSLVSLRYLYRPSSYVCSVIGGYFIVIL